MTNDMMFGELDLEVRLKELEREVQSLNMFLAKYGLATAYLKWNKKGED